MKYWGLKENGDWMIDGDYIIVHFASETVANVQKEILTNLYADMNDSAVITVEEIK